MFQFQLEMLLHCWLPLAFLVGNFAIGIDHSLCGTKKREVSAREYFDHGELLVANNKTSLSIPFYRAAVRLCPSNTSYWCQLVAVEYLADLHDKASTRLCTIKSLEQLTTSLPCNLQSEIYASYNNTLCSAVDKPQYGPLGLCSEFNGPCVYRSAVSLTLTESSFLEHLYNNYGDEKVHFYPQNMLTPPQKRYEVPLSEAIDFLHHPEGAYVSSDISERGTYIQWTLNQSLFDQFQSLVKIVDLTMFHNSSATQFIKSAWPNMQFTNEEINLFLLQAHWFMLLVGETKAGMFFHEDLLSLGSYQLQIFGQKKWLICPPKYHVNSNVDKQDKFCKEAVISAGDMVYYPAGYGHQTECIYGPCISLSSSIVHNPFASKEEIIEKHCGNGSSPFLFPAVFCQTDTVLSTFEEL